MQEKRCGVIMQPTFLPWIGYFDLIDQSEAFVFLDTVQFEKQSWQQRNKIITHNGFEWVTAPVFLKGRFGQLIKDVEINPIKFPDKILKQIKQNYSRAQYFKTYYPEFADVFRDKAKDLLLSKLNIDLILWFCDKIGISLHFYRASELDIDGKRSQLLIQILKEIGISDYLSPLGSAEYLKEDSHIFLSNSIRVYLHNYEYPAYQQPHDPFLPYASVIDLLFNEGEKSLYIIRSGRKPNILLEELQ